MRIMLDTNILISMFLFPTQKMGRLFELIVSENLLVISTYIISELRSVADRKFPRQKDVIEKVINRMRYELVSSQNTDCASFDIQIRDPKDYPIYFDALHGDVDILITGDNDLLCLKTEKPEILTPAEFLKRYDQSN